MAGASTFLTVAFVAVVAGTLAVAVTAFAVAARRAGRSPRRAAGTGAAWLVAICAVTALLAATGTLSGDPPPPTMMMAVAVVVAGAVWLSLSGVGTSLATHLPLHALIGISAFRLPLELVMHRAALERVMPTVMSYSGRNFDILTGIIAALIALFYQRTRVPAWVAVAWNVMGLALLVNVVVVSVLATPLFDYFPDEIPNTWITTAPFVWLPTVLVPLALLSHLLVFRAIRLQPRG